MGPRLAFCQGCSDWKAGGVSGGDVRAGPAGVSCRGNEHPRGLAGVRAGPQDGTKMLRSRCRSIARQAATAAEAVRSRESSIGFWKRSDQPPASNDGERIFDRLRDEYGFTGGYTIVKDYVREQGPSREVRATLHSPGHAQADFGEAMAVIGGALRKIHFLAFDLPHSDGCFVAAYPADGSILRWPQRGVAFFGGVPRSILYDNTKLAVARINGKRQRTRVFTELQSHYLFEDRFGRPGKGNDKGKVEGLVGFIRRNFCPLPRAESFAASTMLSPNSAAGADGAAAGPQGDHRRASRAGSSSSLHCRLLPMMPAISALDGRVRVAGGVTAATTIPCPWPTATVRCSSGATSMRW